MPNTIPIQDRAWKIVQILTGLCLLCPSPACAARQRSQPGWEFRGTAAWRALWHRSSSDPSLSLALAPSCCSPHQGDVTGDTSCCWCQALFPKSQALSPRSARCSYKHHLHILWVPGSQFQQGSKEAYGHTAFPLRQVSQSYRAALIPTRMLQQM